MKESSYFFPNICWINCRFEYTEFSWSLLLPMTAGKICSKAFWIDEIWIGRMEKGKFLMRDNLDGFGGIKFQPSIEVTSCNNENINNFEKNVLKMDSNLQCRSEWFDYSDRYALDIGHKSDWCQSMHRYDFVIVFRSFRSHNKERSGSLWMADIV